MLRGPAEHRIAIVRRGGVAVFGSEPIVHVDDDAAGLDRKEPAEAVVLLEIAEDPAAAVEVEEDRGAFGLSRTIDAKRDGAAWTFEGMVDGLKHRDGRRGVADPPCVTAPADLVDRQRCHIGQRRLLARFEDCDRFRVERHEGTSSRKPDLPSA